VRDQLGRAADGGGDDRDSRGHGLQHRHREALAQRREHERVEAGQDRGDVPAQAGEHHPLREAQATGLGLRLGTQGAVAHHEAAKGRDAGGGQRHRTQEDLGGLGGNEAAHEADDPLSFSEPERPEGLSPLPAQGGRDADPVVDDAPAPAADTPGLVELPHLLRHRDEVRGRGSERPVEREVVGLLPRVEVVLGRHDHGDARRHRGEAPPEVGAPEVRVDDADASRAQEPGEAGDGPDVGRPPLAEAHHLDPRRFRQGREGTGLVEAEDDGLEAPAVEASREPDDDLLRPPEAERPDDLGDADHGPALPRRRASASITGMVSLATIVGIGCAAVAGAPRRCSAAA
jgi:hypothetical protein